MPNHVANRITGPCVDEIKKILSGTDSEVDFNRLIPMPETLSLQCSLNVVGAAEWACRDFPDTSGSGLSGLTSRLHMSNLLDRTSSPLQFGDEDWGMFIQCLQNKRLHGEYCWYEWALKHWGTKWNAYDVNVIDGSIYFKTAWSCPTPIVQALAKSLPPDASFVWEFADEDFGNNLGIWEFSGVELRSVEQEEGRFQPSPEEWAMRLHGYSDSDIAEYRAECEE
jgi:hypothetical protein